MAVMPLQVIVEGVTYTRSREPVTIQYAGADRAGILAGSRCYSTTQTALMARASADVVALGGDRWANDEVNAELIAYFASKGITVEIVEPT